MTEASVLTRAADEALAEIEALVQEVILEIAPAPLGFELVPPSTRRGKMKRDAQALGDLLVGLAHEFGPEQVWAILGEQVQGQVVLQKLQDEFGAEVLQQALVDFTQRIDTESRAPASEAFLAERS